MVPKYSFKGNKHKYKALRALAGLFVLFSLACSALIISVSAGCTGAACCDSCEKHLNDTANISVNFPVLIVNKSIEPETFEQGDLIKFKIEVINVGGASAYGLSIKDVLNENLTYVQSIYDNSSSNYLIYKFVFNVTGDGKYSCENLNKQWTSDYSQCVPTESIDFHLYGDELTWGQYGTSGGKELPGKTGYVIVFYARAKENASAGNFTNNVNVKANYDAHQYICNEPSSCLGGSCKDSTGQTCSIGSTCYCDGCVQPPVTSSDDNCFSTEIKLTDYENLNLSIKPNLNASANFTLNEKAEIYLTKEINSTKTNFEVGENINFVLTLNSNLNSPNVNATLTDVEIVDSLPYGIKFLNASLCNETDRTLNLTTIPRLNKTIVDGSDVLNLFIGNMTKDTSEIKICINTKVTSDASNAYGVLKNKANVSAKNVRAYETKILKAQAEVPFYILKNADVKISKRTLTQSVIPGANATYEITLWNEGDSEATEIIVNDTLPCNFEYINNSYNIIEGSDGTDYENFTVLNIDSKNVVFKISKIYGNKIIKWTFNVSVPGNVTGMCENVAKINAKDINGNNLTSYLDKSYLFIEGGTAYLQVNKEILNNRLFAVGDIVQYKITVRNSGSVQSVNNVILKDFLPLGMKFVNTTIPDCNTSNISGDYQTGGEILICTLGNIAPGTTKIYYLNARIMESRPALSNKVEVNGNSTNGEQWFKDSVVAYIGKPVLKIEKKQSSNNVKPGSVVTYTLNISNIGDAPAYNVSVKDTLPSNWGPSGYELYTITCSDGDNASSGYVTEVGFFGQKIKTLHFDKKNPMNPGVSCKITYSIKIPDNAQPGLYTNNAEINGNDALNNSLSGDKTYRNILVNEVKDIMISKNADKNLVSVGDNVTFTINLKNTGNVNLDVELTDYLPYGFVNLTQVNYVFTLSPGSDKNIIVTAKVNESAFSGLNTNHARAIVKKNGTVVIEKDVYASVYVSSPFIKVKKWTSTSTVEPGKNAEFFVMVENTGTGDASNLIVSDEFDFSNASNITKINCNANITLGTYPNLITSGTIKKGEKCIIGYNITIPINASGLYQNIVFANSSLSTDMDKAYVNVISRPEFNVWKLSNVSDVDINEEINFTIFVENSGNVPLNLNISDVIPQGFINLTPARFNNLSINPGEIKNYSIIAKANSNASDLSVNCVNVNATTPQGQILYKNACVNVHIKRPLLLIEKWTTTPSRLPGEDAEFYVMLKNDGDGKATNIKVTDESNMTNLSSVIAYEGNCNGLTIGTYPDLITNGTLLPNQYCIIQYNMSVPDANGYTNTATLNATDMGGRQLNIEKSSAYVLASGITPSISVEKYVTNGNHHVDIGDYANFTVKIKNLGNVNITIKNISDTSPQGFSCNYENWTKTVLEPNNEAFINISCFVNSSALQGINVNEVRVDAIGAGGVVVSQSDNEFVIVEMPRLAIKKTQDSINKIPGDVVTYTLNISNIGDAPAYNVSVKDTLPSNWGPSGYELYTITCSDGDNASSGYVTEVGFFGQKIKTLHFDKKNPMNPGVSCKITYKIKIPSDTKTGIYTNNAEVSGNDKTNNTMIEKDKSTTYVKGDARMFVSVKANTTYVKKGENVKFSIRIENLGDVQLENVTVTDILPPGFENLTPAIINVGNIEVRGVKDESNGLFVIARVVNDTNASIGGAHVNKVYVEGTSYGGIIMKAESYATVYITSTPLSLVGDVDETTLFTNSDAKLRFIIINPSMFDTQDIYLNVTLIPGLRYNKNSTMLNGVPLTDDENNGVVENDGNVIEWKNLSVYSKSIAILTFSVHVENYTYGRINASISYNQHNEIGTASTFIDIDKNFVSKPFIYLLQEKDTVNINEPVTYKLIIDDTFNKLKGNTSVKFNFEGLKILDEKSINENLTDILNNNSIIEIKFSALPDPKLSSKLMVNAEILNINGNETQILNISKITDLLIPPEGILTNVTLKNSNISVNLKNEKMNYTLHLKQGWNLIGLPIIPESTKLEEILKPIEGKYTDVFTYDNKWNYKSKYMNKWFGDLAQIEVGRGYWIKVDEDVNLTLDGYEVKNFSLSLNQGWNLISIPSVESMEINKIDNYTDIFTYEDKWIYRSRYMNKWFGSLNETEGGKGYWIKVENNKILTKAE